MRVSRKQLLNELGSLKPKVVCYVSQNGVESPYSKTGVIGDCDVVGTTLMRCESNGLPVCLVMR